MWLTRNRGATALPNKFCLALSREGSATCKECLVVSGYPLRGKFYMLAENSRYRINLGRFLTRQATLCEKAIAEKMGANKL
jgi:hypothetical protein